MSTGSDINDPGGFAIGCHQAVYQQVSKQKMAQMICLQLGFEPVLRQNSVSAHFARVVDENVDGGKLLFHLIRK